MFCQTAHVMRKIDVNNDIVRDKMCDCTISINRSFICEHVHPFLSKVNGYFYVD